jgi:acyl carrier protein
MAASPWETEQNTYKETTTVPDDIFDRFKGVAVKILAVEPDQVTKEASFGEDLDADSLDLAEFVMGLEDEFDVEVEEDELEGITTVGLAYDLIVAKLAAK